MAIHLNRYDSWTVNETLCFPQFNHKLFDLKSTVLVYRVKMTKKREKRTRSELHVSLILCLSVSKIVLIIPVAARGLMLSRSHETRTEAWTQYLFTWIKLFYSGTPTLFGSYFIVNKTVSSICSFYIFMCPLLINCLNV